MGYVGWVGVLMVVGGGERRRLFVWEEESVLKGSFLLNNFLYMKI